MSDHCEILILYKTRLLEPFAKKLAQSNSQNKSYVISIKLRIRKYKPQTIFNVHFPCLLADFKLYFKHIILFYLNELLSIPYMDGKLDISNFQLN